MGPPDSTDPDCTFQQASILSKQARILTMWKHLGNDPWEISNTERWGLVWGASGRKLLKEMGE